MQKKILIIGAGITAAIITNALIRTTTSSTLPIELYIWERSTEIGGRFATTISPLNPNCTADLGAQYLTYSLDNKVTQPYFEDLMRNKLISQCHIKDIPAFLKIPSYDKAFFVCNHGTGAVVKHFLCDCKNIILNREVVSMKVADDGRIQVLAKGQSKPEIFDIVLSTMPVPLLLQLGNIDSILGRLGDPDLKRKLYNVSYTPMHALGLFYKDKLTVAPTVSWMNFVDENKEIQYWTLEDEKRLMGQANSSLDKCSSAVIYSTESFSSDNIDTEEYKVKDKILRHVTEACKNLQQKQPEFIDCQKWRYAHVNKVYNGSHGFVILSKSPLILAAGDSFVESGFENCILSAERTAQYLVKVLELMEWILKL